MMELFRHVSDVIEGKVPLNKTRSKEWPKVRQQHLLLHPTCAVCGKAKNLQVHHIRPFHLHPELELDPSNLITLCESKKGGVNCHLFFGHLGNFKSFNVTVLTDTPIWNTKIETRPMGETE